MSIFVLLKILKVLINPTALFLDIYPASDFSYYK